MFSLEDALRNKLERANDDVQSTARILLPFPVQNHIEGQNNLAFRDWGDTTLYNELKAKVKNYSISVNKDDFEEY